MVQDEIVAEVNYSWSR